MGDGTGDSGEAGSWKLEASAAGRACAAASSRGAGDRERSAGGVVGGGDLGVAGVLRRNRFGLAVAEPTAGRRGDRVAGRGRAVRRRVAVASRFWLLASGF